MENQAANPPAQSNIQVRYEDFTARYANHALISTSNEEVYLDFSSGIIVDRAAGAQVMPIHTRIAMTPSGVVRLWQLLGQTVQNFRVVQVPPQPAPAQPVEAPEGNSETPAS